MARNLEMDKQPKGGFIRSVDETSIKRSSEETDKAENESRNLAFHAPFLLC